MTNPIWGVFTLLTIGLLGTLWWIFVILKLAHTEDNVSLQNQENRKNH